MSTQIGGEDLTSYEKYQRFRNKLGITDYEVSKQTGISTATLSNWRNGNYEPKLDKRLAIARYFGVNLEQLIGD